MENEGGRGRAGRDVLSERWRMRGEEGETRERREAKRENSKLRTLLHKD